MCFFFTWRASPLFARRVRFHAVARFLSLPTCQAFLDETDNLPITVCMVLSELLNEIKLGQGGGQTAKDLLWWQMESFVHELLQLVGEGEAIAETPVPLAYSRHTSRLLSVVSWGDAGCHPDRLRPRRPAAQGMAAACSPSLLTPPPHSGPSSCP